MPDPRPPSDNGFEQQARETREQRRRLRAGAEPSGTQLVSLKSTVENRLAQIPGEVSAAITAQSMTKADIQAGLDAKANTSHKHAGEDLTSGTVSRPVASPTSVTATGDGSFGGNTTVTGRLTATAGVTSVGVRSNQVTTGYVAMYVDQNGNFGYAPSTMATKTLLRNFTVDLEKWLTLIPKVVAYKDDPSKTPQVALIAELIVKREPMLGIYDETRKLRGIRYELLGVVCLALIQAHVAETRETTRRLDALLAYLNLDL